MIQVGFIVVRNRTLLRWFQSWLRWDPDDMLQRSQWQW